MREGGEILQSDVRMRQRSVEDHIAARWGPPVPNLPQECHNGRAATATHPHMEDMVFYPSIDHDAVHSAIVEVVTAAQIEGGKADDDFKPYFGCTLKCFTIRGHRP